MSPNGHFLGWFFQGYSKASIINCIFALVCMKRTQALLGSNLLGIIRMFDKMSMQWIVFIKAIHWYF